MNEMLEEYGVNAKIENKHIQTYLNEHRRLEWHSKYAHTHRERKREKCFG